MGIDDIQSIGLWEFGEYNPSWVAVIVSCLNPLCHALLLNSTRNSVSIAHVQTDINERDS